MIFVFDVIKDMDVSRLVLPNGSEANSTALVGRSRLKFLEETNRVSLSARDFGQELGRSSLQLIRSGAVGYRGDVACEEEEEELEESVDEWDTSSWSCREIQKACEVLIAASSQGTALRREKARGMLAVLTRRHREAYDYVQANLENLVNHALPSAVYGLDDAALNLAPLLEDLSAEFARQLCEVNTIRRIVNLLLVEPTAAIVLIQAQVRLRFFSKRQAQRLARRFELSFLVERWRKRSTLLLRAGISAKKREDVALALRCHIVVLENICTSTTKQAKQQLCAQGRGTTALVCAATKDKRYLRLLLFMSKVPSIVRHLLSANVAGLCVAALADSKDAEAALGVLEALALSTLKASTNSDDLLRVSPEDACELLIRPQRVAAVLKLLDRPRCLLGAVRFAHHCAATCDRGADVVLQEVLAFGGRPLERIILDGIGSKRDKLPGFASVELFAQLAARPAHRTSLELSGAQTMLEPYLATLDARSPAFLRALAAILFISQEGTMLFREVNEKAEEDEIVRTTLMRMLLRDSAKETTRALHRLGAARPLVEFLCQPKRGPTFAYQLQRRVRCVHCIALHRLFLHGMSTSFSRALAEAGGQPLLQFASAGAQAGIKELDKKDVAPLEDIPVILAATEAAFKTLSLFASADLDGQRTTALTTNNPVPDKVQLALLRDKRPDNLRKTCLQALGEQSTSLRQAVADHLLSTSALRDIVKVLGRAPTNNDDSTDVVAAAASVLASAAPSPLSERLWSMDAEPMASDASSYEAAEEMGLCTLRRKTLSKLLENVSIDSPIQLCAAASGALAKLGCTPRGSEALRASGAVRSMAMLSPRRPVLSQSVVDAVLAEVPVKALVDEDKSAPDYDIRLNTCRLLRLPVAWYELAAAMSVSPAACRALLETGIVARAIDRFCLATDKPKIDELIRISVAALVARISENAARSHELKAHTGQLHETSLVRLSHGLSAMLVLPDRRSKYYATWAVASLCDVNVAAAVPRFLAHIPQLVEELLCLSLPQTRMCHVLVALRAVLRYPFPDSHKLVAPDDKLGRIMARLKHCAVLTVPDKEKDDGRAPIDRLARSLLILLSDVSSRIPASSQRRTKSVVGPTQEKETVETEQELQEATIIEISPSEAKSAPAKIFKKQTILLPAPMKKKKRAKSKYPKVDTTTRPDLAATRPFLEAPLAFPPTPTLLSDSFTSSQKTKKKSSMLIDPVFGDPPVLVGPEDDGEERRLDRGQRYEFPCINDKIPAVTFENIHEIVSRRRRSGR